jgi:GxxExxY protein
MRADINPIIDDLTAKIIGSAFTVSNTLGHGFLENVYKNALIEELSLQGVIAVKEKSFAVQYKGRQVGFYIADIVVADCVIVELKAADRLID